MALLVDGAIQHHTSEENRSIKLALLMLSSECLVREKLVDVPCANTRPRALNTDLRSAKLKIFHPSAPKEIYKMWRERITFADS